MDMILNMLEPRAPAFDTANAAGPADS